MFRTNDGFQFLAFGSMGFMSKSVGVLQSSPAPSSKPFAMSLYVVEGLARYSCTNPFAAGVRADVSVDLQYSLEISSCHSSVSNPMRYSSMSSPSRRGWIRARRLSIFTSFCFFTRSSASLFSRRRLSSASFFCCYSLLEISSFSFFFLFCFSSFCFFFPCCLRSFSSASFFSFRSLSSADLCLSFSLSSRRRRSMSSITLLFCCTICVRQSSELMFVLISGCSSSCDATTMVLLLNNSELVLESSSVYPTPSLSLSS